MLNLVVLDGFTLNPGDLSWDLLHTIAHTTLHDRTSPDQVVPRALHAELLLTNKTPITAHHLDALPNLRYIGVLATGHNIVDIRAAAARHIPVTNIPTYGTRSVAQLTFALILELAHHAGHHAHAVQSLQRWSKNPDFCFWDHPLVELESKTLGIIGLGRIGTAVATLGQAFGMKILATPNRSKHATLNEVTRAPLETLLAISDIVSLHCPLSDHTKHLINRERLALMKPSAWLINTSRGPLIDEDALADALTTGRLGAAALDVLSAEPPPPNHPLFTAPNCLITPHIAWATRAARERLLSTAASNLAAFLNGQPVNIVNLPAPA